MYHSGMIELMMGVAAMLDDWREKLAANPHKTTEANSPQ